MQVRQVPLRHDTVQVRPACVMDANRLCPAGAAKVVPVWTMRPTKTSSGSWGSVGLAFVMGTGPLLWQCRRG